MIPVSRRKNKPQRKPVARTPNPDPSANITIKAIETSYAGCRFRSRLEARWAVFFDAAGVVWQYEPQGYSLPSGPYLPDFWLPYSGVWFEVKPTFPDGRTIALAWDLCNGTGAPVTVACGEIDRPMLYKGNHLWTGASIGCFQADTNDAHAAPGISLVYVPILECADCREVFAVRSFAELLYREDESPRVHALHLPCPNGTPDSYGKEGRGILSEKVVAAAIEARSARFEFGERGRPPEPPKDNPRNDRRNM